MWCQWHPSVRPGRGRVQCLQVGGGRGEWVRVRERGGRVIGQRKRERRGGGSLAPIRGGSSSIPATHSAAELDAEVREEFLLALDDLGVGHRFDDPAVHHDAVASATRVAKRTFCSTSRMATPDFSISRIKSPIALTITGASPSVGSSKRISRAPLRRTAGDRQHLLLAARERRAHRFAALRAGSGRARRPCRAATRRRFDDRRKRQVLDDRERRGDAALLGHEADAAPRDLVGAQRRDRLPSNTICRCGGARSP